MNKNIKQEAQNLYHDLAAEQVQIALVDSYDAGPPSLVYVTRIGQTTPDAQGYPHLTSYMSPAAGGTVILRRVGSGWFVEGDLGPPAAGGTGGGGTTVSPHAFTNGTIHTATGLNSGDFLRATSGSTFAFQTVTAGSIGAAGTAHASTHLEAGNDALADVPTLTKRFTNVSGASVAAGDVVVISGTSGAFSTTTQQALYTRQIGVALETIADTATGRIALVGYVAAVQVTGTVAAMDWLTTSTTAKKAVSAGGSGQGPGTFALALTGGTNTTIQAFLLLNNIGSLHDHSSSVADKGGLVAYSSLVSRAHALTGGDHSLSGLTAGQALRATGTTSAAFGNATKEVFVDASAPAAPGAGLTVIYTVSGKPRYRADTAGADTGLADLIHNLVDTTNHPVSGLTTGHVLQALSATTYGFAIEPVHASRHAEGAADPLLSTGDIATDFSTAPSLKQNAVAIATQTVNTQKYHKAGKKVSVWIKITAGSAGPGNNEISVSIPAGLAGNLAANSAVGAFEYFRSGIRSHTGTVRMNTSTLFTFIVESQTTTLGGAPAFAVANNDFISFHAEYTIA